MQQPAAIPYRRISLFFILILAVLTWGFYKTYLIFFPAFEGFTYVQHFHGAMMMTWMAMLIVQPLLIGAGKVKVHHFIGKLSFVIAPLVVVSIFLAARTSYLRPEPPMPEAERVAFIALPIPAMVAFAVLYMLAMLNRRDTYHHMRYMIGTGLLMIGPGLGRALIIYYNYSLPEAVNIHNYLILGIAAALVIYDIVRKRSYAANATVLTVLWLTHLIWSSRDSGAWQGVGKFIAKNLFG